MVEFLGAARPSAASELVPPLGPPIRRDELHALAAGYEAAGFDGVLAGQSSSSADAGTVAGEYLFATARLGVVVSVRPGVVAPTVAGRALATLDALHPGRVGLHLPPVHDDTEARRDGDWSSRPDRQLRRAEFAAVVHRSWASWPPFDHDGEHYHLAGAWSSVRPSAPLPIYISGASAASDELAGRHGDVYLLPSEPVHQLGSRMTRAVALAGGRPLRFGLRLRPLVAATRRDADQYATRVARRQRTSELPVSALLREATGAIGNPRELIGTPETVADALLRYREWGIEVFHLVGYEPLSDLAGFAEVIDLVRRAEAVAVRTIAG